jgi:hypothetical protein
MRAILTGAALVAVLALGCTIKPQRTDTGYTGTWSRGTEYARRIVTIAKQGDRYLFRPGVRSQDGQWQWRCEWEGRCQEKIDGEITSEYTFRTWIDPETGHLMVECTGKVWKPTEVAMHYVDELVLEPGGTKLAAYTNERDGRRFEGDHRPKFVFTKVADTVGDPPPATAATR